MAEVPPTLRKGRMVAILLVVAIVLVVGAVIYFTRPAAELVVDTVEAPPADPQPLGFYLAQADAARGEAFFQRCSYCHSIAPDNRHTLGPTLYGVMGQPIASRPGYRYSPALADKGGTWDWESTNRFLQLPRAFAPGTRMTFAGVRNPQDRADVMVYMNREGGTLTPPAGAR